MGIMETVLEIPAEHEANVFGQFDAFAKKIERSLHVTLISRDGVVKIINIHFHFLLVREVLHTSRIYFLCQIIP